LIPEPARLRAIELIEEACSAGAGLVPACGVSGISTRTFQRWKQPFGQLDWRKKAERTVANKLTPEERQTVLDTANSNRFKDLPPCKIVPMLADEGGYLASESTFYRVLKEKNQLAHRGKSKPAKNHRPRECVAGAPCQVWTWDITYLPTQIRGIYFYLYMIVDIYSRKIVGFRVHTEERAEHASRLMEQACIDEKIAPNQLILHQDNGSPMKASVFHATLQRLGVIPSFSRPSVSDDNPFSEALFKTMKYRPEFPLQGQFNTLVDAIMWCEWFVDWYNNQHLHSELKFLTPNQRHKGEDAAILASRHNAYLLAKQKNPLRWSGRKTRNWELPDKVTLNPDRKNKLNIAKKELRCIMAA
jgi:putative transposase